MRRGPLSASANEALDRQPDLHQVAILLQSLSALTGKTFSMGEARNMVAIPRAENFGAQSFVPYFRNPLMRTVI